MDFLDIFKQVLMLYIIMMIGTVIYRLKVINDETLTRLSKLMLHVTIPANILMGLSNSGDLVKSDFLQMVILSALSYLFVMILSVVVLRVFFIKKEERPFYQYISIFGNIGFIGYPMLMIIIGKEALLLGAVVNIFYSLLLYSLGIYLMSQYSEEENTGGFEWKRLISPGIIIAVLSIVFFFLDIRLPGVLNDTVEMLGGMTSPMAMIVLGASINKINFKTIIKNYRIIIISIMKMVAYPISFAYILRLLGFTGMPAMVAVVLMGMPIATTAVITALEFNKKNLVKASEASVFSTLLLIVTIPVLIYSVSIVGV